MWPRGRGAGLVARRAPQPGAPVGGRRMRGAWRQVIGAGPRGERAAPGGQRMVFAWRQVSERIVGRGAGRAPQQAAARRGRRGGPARRRQRGGGGGGVSFLVNLPTDLTPDLPTYLQTYLFAYLPIYLPPSLPPYLPFSTPLHYLGSPGCTTHPEFL